MPYTLFVTILTIPLVLTLADSVSALPASSADDEAPSPRTVSSGVSAANITLIYPPENGAVPAGKRVAVRWHSNNTLANGVTLEVDEAGMGWRTIASGLPSNGTADWDVPGFNYPAGKVRVTAATTGGPISATSSNVFIDSTPPVSFVHVMGGYKRCIDTNATGNNAEIPFSAWDNFSSGVAYVEIWWRIEHRGGAFAEEPDARTNRSPFIFPIKKEGTYEFFTIAVDRAGNREKMKFFNETSVTLDIHPPQVFATSPEPDTKTSFWPSFQIMMSERMNLSDTAVIEFDPQGPRPIFRTWDEYYATLIFSIDRPLVPGQHYNITISGANDRCGKPMVPSRIHFQVADPPIPSWGNVTLQFTNLLTNEPVSGVRGEAFYANKTSLVRSGLSSDEGELVLPYLPPTSYNISVRAPGFEEFTFPLTLEPDSDRFLGFGMIPPGYRVGSLEGRVIDSKGAPVEGAELSSDDGSRAASNAFGRYHLTLREGRRTITVSKAGEPTVSFEIEVKAGESQVRDVSLVSPPRGAPLPGPQPWQAAGLGLAAGAGFVATLFVFGGEAMKLALLLIPIALYSRVKREGVLDHFVRGKIYGFVVAQPGVRYMTLLKSLKLANGTASYHLYVLEREGLIRSVRDRGLRRFYSKDAPAAEGGVILSKVQQAIVNLVGKRPGITQTQMRGELAMPHQNVSYNVRRLVSMGVVSFKWTGLRKRYYSSTSPETAD